MPTTTDEQPSYESNVPYFEERRRKLKHYLARFPDGIDFRGKRVLDLGCGHGALAFTAVELGAKEVVGVDICSKLINFAQWIQADRFQETSDTLRFEERDILDGGLDGFDIVVSEATFEHVIGLARYLEAIKNMLAPGGRLYTGYSPLYNSPWGDHHRLKAPFNKYLPWTHLFFPQGWLFRRLGTENSLNNEQVTRLEDVGLNGLSFAEHERILKNAGMELVFFEANNPSRPAMRAVNLLRASPVFRELLTFSIYAILEKQ